MTPDERLARARRYLADRRSWAENVLRHAYSPRVVAVRTLSEVDGWCRLLDLADELDADERDSVAGHGYDALARRLRGIVLDALSPDDGRPPVEPDRRAGS